MHPRDLDHEDDDLLDDLAQIVMAKGGEVVVANEGEMSPATPALAILHPRSLNFLQPSPLRPVKRSHGSDTQSASQGFE